MLAELASDQLAVLEEYYAIDTPASPDGQGRSWRAKPANVPEITQLRVAATDRGERTLIVDDRVAIELWRYVPDSAPVVVVRVTGG